MSSDNLMQEIVDDNKNIAYNKIVNMYPLWKQLNILALNGYTQKDRDAMNEFIAKVRCDCNNKETVIINTSEKELKKIQLGE